LEEQDQQEVDGLVERNTMACFAHILQLTVKDDLSKLTSATDILTKCSKLTSLTHQSVQFCEAFENSFDVGRSIPKLNATRWNCTFIRYLALLT